MQLKTLSLYLAGFPLALVLSADTLTLRDGTTFRGTFLRGDARTVEFHHENGRTSRIPATRISSVRFGDEMEQTRGRIEPNASALPNDPGMRAIEEKHRQFGSASGMLGAATGRDQMMPDGRGVFRETQAATIYWHPNSGAHEVHGLIRDKYRELGGPAGALGYPRTDEMAADRGGRASHFQNGSIYYHPSFGAHALYGAIRDRWMQMGAEKGKLGYPKSGETNAANGARHVIFEHGSIYWHPEAGAHAVYGRIRDEWFAQGHELAQIGYPTSDAVYQADGSGYQHFQRGTIYADAHGNVRTERR